MAFIMTAVLPVPGAPDTYMLPGTILDKRSLRNSPMTLDSEARPTSASEGNAECRTAFVFW